MLAMMAASFDMIGSNINDPFNGVIEIKNNDIKLTCCDIQV